MVPPRRPARRGPARLGASLSVLALLAGPGSALAQAAPPAAPAAPVQGPVPPAPVPSAAAPAPEAAASVAKSPEVRPAEKLPEAKSQEAKPQEAGVQENKAQELPPKKSRAPAPLVYAKVSADPNPTLTPRTFLDTLKAAERYAAFTEAGGWERLPEDLARLKPGERSPAIPALRHHLTLTGDLAPDAPPSDRLDPSLVAAVSAFQARHGLPDGGILGRLTINALNVPAAVRQRQLAASAARLMGSKFPFGERYVVVNIPSAAVEAVEGGTVVRRYVAVVGSPDKATPTVETRITDINFNPTWTVPVSVVKNEIIPQMRKNPGYLARNRIRILGPGGTQVDPTRVDWASERAVNYTLRQDSGLDNALGQVRIDMPNRFAVYMHDTPAKSLFAASVRFHSHGCVRVGQVKEFVGWLLQGVEGPNGPGSAWGPIEIETGIADGERRDIRLGKAVPVTFVYLTGYAGADGRVHFRDDIYGLDSPAPEPAATGTLPPPARSDAAPEPRAAPVRSGAAPAIPGQPPAPARTVRARTVAAKAVPAKTAPPAAPPEPAAR